MRKCHLIYLLLLAILMFAIPSASNAQGIAVGVSVRIAPPVLPVYTQPICPGAGYIWTPGYWGYGDDGYFWVPGTWVVAPRVGFLWTPGYWGWGGGAYLWHVGYWGPHVGFYGGVNYGFGYGGVGFEGGYWNHGVFAYNRSVSNVNVSVIHNTYSKTVVTNTTVNRTSFNGGTGGVAAQPTAEERNAEHEEHVQATSEQTQHEHAAGGDRNQLASVNHGNPAVAATPKAGQMKGEGVVAANHSEARTENTEKASAANKSESNKNAENKNGAKHSGKNKNNEKKEHSGR